MRPTKLFYDHGEDVRLQFELINESKDDYYILDWNTPFEGFLSKFLDVALVTLETQQVKYIGRLVTRGHPSRKDYLRLLAGSTLKTTLLMNEAYDISSSGVYRVVFNTALKDVKTTQKGDNFDPSRFGTGFKHIPLYTDIVIFIVRNPSKNSP